MIEQYSSGRVEYPKPNNFYSNFLDSDVCLLLASSLQKRGVEGIRVSDNATDAYGRAIKGRKALFLSDKARTIYKAINNSPEMKILEQVTSDYFHLVHGDEEPKFDDVAPGFWKEKTQRRLRALSWDVFARHCREIFATTGGMRESETKALAKRRALLSPNWLNLSLPDQHELSQMVDRIVDLRFPVQTSPVKANQA